MLDNNAANRPVIQVVSSAAMEEAQIAITNILGMIDIKRFLTLSGESIGATATGKPVNNNLHSD